MTYEAQYRQQFRGDYRDRIALQPIDPSRPHRFREGDVGAARACAICACYRADGIHSDTARQRTVDERGD